MAAGRGGRCGKALKPWALRSRSWRRRSGRRRVRSGRETPTSKQGKLERKRAAARGSRKERRTREAGRNLNYRLDFGVPEPRRANALSALMERRSCGWRCLSRRRTSLRGENRTDAARCGKYSAIAEILAYGRGRQDGATGRGAIKADAMRDIAQDDAGRRLKEATSVSLPPVACPRGFRF